MGSKQFGRYYEVIVDTIKIKTLDIKFKAVKTLKKEPNTLELSVMNLNDDHRQQLQQKEDPVVQLDVGYISKHGVIFLGDVRDVNSTYNKPTWVTDLASGDGEKATQFDRINKSFVKGTSLKTVMESLGQAMPDIGSGNLKKLADSGKLPGSGTDEFVNGITVSGNASREMDRIVRTAGLEWSIQNKEFQLLEAGKALQTEAVVLSPDSGLIGSPTIGNDGVLLLRCLLNSDILPGKQLRVKSSLIDGLFRADRCEYSGNSAGDDWYIDIEAKELKV